MRVNWKSILKIHSISPLFFWLKSLTLPYFWDKRVHFSWFPQELDYKDSKNKIHPILSLFFGIKSMLYPILRDQKCIHPWFFWLKCYRSLIFFIQIEVFRAEVMLKSILNSLFLLLHSWTGTRFHCKLRLPSRFILSLLLHFLSLFFL